MFIGNIPRGGGGGENFLGNLENFPGGQIFIGNIPPGGGENFLGYLRNFRGGGSIFQGGGGDFVVHRTQPGPPS